MNDSSPSKRRMVQARLGLAPPHPSAGRAVNSPSVVNWLLLFMGIVFVAQAFGPRDFARLIDVWFGFIPARFEQGPGLGLNALELIFPLFGHMFVHANIAHIVMNGLGLLIFGTAVARRLLVEIPLPGAAMWNTFLLLVFYSLCGVAGALFWALFPANEGNLLIGASGAISGLMGATMRFALRRDAPYGVGFGELSPVTAQPVLIASLAYIAFNLMTAIGIGPSGGGLNIAWEAHVGGYVFGLVTFPLFDAIAKRPKLGVFG